MFSSRKTQTTNVTENRQQAIQGDKNIQVSSSNFTGAGNVTFNDPELQLKAMEVAAGATNAVAVIAAGSINGAQQTSIRALQALQDNEAYTRDVITDATQAVADMAAHVTPVNEGEIAKSNNKVLIGLGIGSLIIVGLVLTHK